MSVHDLLERAHRDARALLDEAYQRGYRNGLASASLHAGATASAPPCEAPAPMPGPIWPDDDPSDDDVEGDAAEAEAERDEEAELETSEAQAVGDSSERPFGRRAEPRPIASRATIATLRARIVEHFGLERFDVEVVLCRKGDAKRRQLKSNVRLAKYLVSKWPG